MGQSLLQSAMFLLRELVFELAALHQKVDRLRRDLKLKFAPAKQKCREREGSGRQQRQPGTKN